MIKNTISCDTCETVISETVTLRRPLEYSTIKLTLYCYGENADGDQHSTGEYHFCKACTHKLKKFLELE